MMHKYFYILVLSTFLSGLSLWANSDTTIDFNGKYSMLFDQKDIYPGAAIELNASTGLSFLDYGLLFQFYILSAEEGPRIFNLDAYLRLKHEFVFSPGSLEIYCTIPLGLTFGAQKYVTYQNSIYERTDGSMNKLTGFNTGVVPGVGFRFNNHWAIFAELGLAYHSMSPEHLQMDSNSRFGVKETIAPDAVNLLTGVFSTGISYRF